MSNLQTRTHLANETSAILRECEIKACYSAQTARILRRRVRIGKFIVAAAASVPLMAKIAALSSEMASWVAAIIPLIAIALAIWEGERTIGTASRLHGQYSEVLPPLRAIWRRVVALEQEASESAAQPIHDELADIEGRIATFRKAIVELPDLKKVHRRCHLAAPIYELSANHDAGDAGSGKEGSRLPSGGGGGGGYKEELGPIYSPM